MKKMYLYVACLSLFVSGLASCGDNEDFSSPHVLTDAEQAELDRQQRERDSLLNALSVDFQFNYEVNITISATSYDGTLLKIETDKIAEKFGITEAELLAGIAAEAGAPEVKGFAIEGSTHADNGTASTTNSPWGHWWDAKSDVTKWGETAMIFCEFDTETGSFYIGQYPGRLADGDTLEVVECLKYNDIRIGVVITVLAKAAGKITAPVVRTQELTIDVLAKSTYDADVLKFNLTQAMADLGVTTMEGVKFVAVNTDGSFTQETTSPPNGFWYDLDGFAGVWGDNASVYTAYGDFAEDEIGIGQFPSRLQGGQSVTVQYGLMANNKIVLLKVKVNLIAYQDPETPPAGDPVAVEQAVALTKAYSNDYAKVKVDVKELLRNAYKKTTYQIHQAIISGELKLYQGSVSEAAPTYTAADVPGYWLKADGTTGEWAESLVWCSIGHSETELFLFGGNHPDNAVAGNVVTTKLIATYNGGSATFNVTFTLTTP
jgi:hypothetical protein